MFYSHEVLTSRKYGVATVWLVATLGAKSNSKKINRKAILDVDVEMACRTISNPEAPMALRLQSNLLYGVTRVYMQQCGYVLSDARNAHNSMKMMLKAVKNAGLDPEAGKARPDQLMLEDDPSFLPEFALPLLDLDLALDLDVPITTPRTGDSQSLTPYGYQKRSVTPDGSIGGLVIPSSSSRVMADFVVHGDDDPVVVDGDTGMLGGNVLEEPDFSFDTDGNLLELTPGPAAIRTPTGSAGAYVLSDAGASARVRQEHEDGQRAGAEFYNDQMDLEFPIINEDLQEGEAFPTAAELEAGEREEHTESSSTVVGAPMRRKRRRARILPFDTTMELRNKDLAGWNTNYLKNMAEAAKLKNQKKVIAQAKKNAEFWVWGMGIGGVGNRLAGATGPSPFDTFVGDKLFELITGRKRKGLAGTKHDRDSGIDDLTQGDGRWVRQKSEEAEAFRNQEDEAYFAGDGDEVELPRDAPTALDDQQMFSAMPWNVSASVRGSSAVPRSGRPGITGSIGGPSSLGTGRAGRMVSASPLHGRGKPGSGGLDALKSLGFGDEHGSFSSEPPGFGADPFMTDSDAFYPGDGGQIPRSTRVQEALSAESGNFLAFVADAIAEKQERARVDAALMSDPLQADASINVEEVLFDELLPPETNNRIVACQGLMMVLALGTRGMLMVRQDEEEFDAEIGIALTEKAKLADIMQIEEGDEGQEDEGTKFVQPEDESQEEADDHDDGLEMEPEGGGQFEEQFQAGGGGQPQDEAEEDTDQDSLYGY